MYESAWKITFIIERGVLVKSNAELVAKLVQITKQLDREIATPNETRQILRLRGIGKVNF